MTGRLRITVLVENSVYGAGLLAEHGVAFLVETGAHRILFDTGQGRALLHNARELGVSLEHLDAIVVSHGHFDHTGALGQVLALPGRPRIYLHPAALEQRYSHRPPRCVEAGMPERCRRAVKQAGARVVWTLPPAEVAPGVRATGEIPRAAPFEDTGGAFYRDPECRLPDLLPDDQALVIDSAAGAVVLLGCAHAGVVNTLRYAAATMGAGAVHAVLGGMHLLHASEERLAATEQAFEEFAAARLGPCHCTGVKPTARLRWRFGGRVAECHAGAVLAFDS